MKICPCLSCNSRKSGRVHSQLFDGFSMLKYALCADRVWAMVAVQAANRFPSSTRALFLSERPAIPQRPTMTAREASGRKTWIGKEELDARKPNDPARPTAAGLGRTAARRTQDHSMSPRASCKANMRTSAQTSKPQTRRRPQCKIGLVETRLSQGSDSEALLHQPFCTFLFLHCAHHCLLCL